DRQVYVRQQRPQHRFDFALLQLLKDLDRLFKASRRISVVSGVVLEQSELGVNGADTVDIVKSLGGCEGLAVCLLRVADTARLLEQRTALDRDPRLARRLGLEGERSLPVVPCDRFIDATREHV